MKRSRLIRVHYDVATEIDKIYRKNNGRMSKVEISKNILFKAKMVKRIKPVMDVHFWPSKRKKMRIYKL